MYQIFTITYKMFSSVQYMKVNSIFLTNITIVNITNSLNHLIHRISNSIYLIIDYFMLILLPDLTKNSIRSINILSLFYLKSKIEHNQVQLLNFLLLFYQNNQNFKFFHFKSFDLCWTILNKSKNLAKPMNNASMSKQTTTIKELKEKLHKSFIDLSNLEQLYKEEIECLKDEYQKKILQLENQNTLLKSKLVQLQPSVYDKTFTSFLNEMDQSVIMPSIKKKASLFLHDQSFLQLTKIPQDAEGIKNKVLQLEREIKKQLGQKPPSYISQYFQTVRNMMQNYSNISQELNKTKDCLQHCEKVKQTQKQKLKNEVIKLKQQNMQLSKDLEKINLMYKNQGLALEHMRKQKQKHLNSSGSIGNFRKGDELMWSKRTADSQKLNAQQKQTGIITPRSRMYNQSPYPNPQ